MDIELSNGALKVFNTLKDSGHQAYFVGGSVRDFFMGMHPTDFDIATDAYAWEMLEIFSEFELVTSGIKHGTVGVITESGVIECTTFRIDGKYSDSRHPQSVKFSRSLREDLSRRDFTVNAMAYCPGEDIVDLFSGRKDIENHILRTIGQADIRFQEDALRILRGMRFCSRLGFTAEKETAKSMKRNAHLLKKISKERITDEAEKILTGDNIGRVMKDFGEIFNVILPGCKTDKNTIEKLCAAPENFEIRLFILLQPLRHIPENSLLRLSAKAQKQIGDFFKMKKPADKAAVKQLLRQFGEESVRKYFSYLGDGRLYSALDEIMLNGECYSLSQLAVKGSDLKKLGFSGREIGETLESLLTAVINGEAENQRQALTAYLILNTN